MLKANPLTHPPGQRIYFFSLTTIFFAWDSSNLFSGTAYKDDLFLPSTIFSLENVDECGGPWRILSNKSSLVMTEKCWTQGGLNKDFEGSSLRERFFTRQLGLITEKPIIFHTLQRELVKQSRQWWDPLLLFLFFGFNKEVRLHWF